MTSNTLGQNIAKFREHAGLSQGELGKLLSVSAQAVSRWEHGGMPDAALVPKIAEALDCTPNDLYASPGASLKNLENLSIEELLERNLRRTPPGQSSKRAIQLSWHLMKVRGALEGSTADALFATATSCEDADKNPVLSPGGSPTNCYFNFDDCLMQASVASDFKYVLMMQEPEAGFASIMRDIQSYQKIFALFAKEYRLQVYLLGFSLPRNLQFTRDYVCKQLGISEELAQEVLDELCDCFLLNCLNIQVADHRVESYTVPQIYNIIPFLYFAGKLMRDGTTFSLVAPLRNDPLLKEPIVTNSPERTWTPISSKKISQQTALDYEKEERITPGLRHFPKSGNSKNQTS